MFPIATKVFASTTIGSELISVTPLPSPNMTLNYLDINYDMESTNITPFRKWILYHNNLWKPETIEDINFIEYVKSNLLEFNVEKDNICLKYYKNDKLWFVINDDKLSTYQDTIRYNDLNYIDYVFFIKKFLLTHYN